MAEQLGRTCSRALVNAAIKDQSIWVLDGDLADSNGAELFIESFPERYIAAGIAEQNMVSMAAGLATTGKKPCVFSFSSFLCYRAYDQIRTCISQTEIPVILIGSHAGACGGRNGKTHVTLNDIAIMASLPNIEIWAPCDTTDAIFAVNQTLIRNVPTYLRVPRDPLENIIDEGKIWQWIGESSKIAILSYGQATHWTLQLQNKLLSMNYNIGIIHVNKLWPIPNCLLHELINKVDHIFIVEDHYRIGGFNSLLYQQLPNIKISIFGWPSEWTGQSGATNQLLPYHEISSMNFINRIISEYQRIYNLKGE